MARPDENVSDQLRRLLKETGGRSKLADFLGHKSRLDQAVEKSKADRTARKSLVQEKMYRPIRALERDALLTRKFHRERIVPKRRDRYGGELAKQARSVLGVELALESGSRSDFKLQLAEPFKGASPLRPISGQVGRTVHLEELMPENLGDYWKKRLSKTLHPGEYTSGSRKGQARPVDTRLALRQLIEANIYHKHKDLLGNNVTEEAWISRAKKFERTVFKGSSFNPALREYEEKLSARTRVFASGAETFEDIVFGGSKGGGRAISTKSDLGVIEGWKNSLRPTELTARELKLVEKIESRPTHIGMYTGATLRVRSEQLPTAASATDFLKNRGFATGGLEPLLKRIEESKANLFFRGNELIATGGSIGRENVSIPLFSTAINPSAAATGGEYAAEYMFKGGSAYSVPSLIGKIGRDTGKLSEPETASRVIYREVLKSLENHHDISQGKLRETINNVLGAQDSLFDESLMWEERVKNTSGLADPVNYAGRPKLGRHLLGSSQQLLMEVDANSTLYNKLLDEYNARKAWHTGFDERNRGQVFGADRLRKEMVESQNAVMKHLERLELEEPNSIFAKKFKNLHFAWGPQSGESVFRPNILDKDRAKQRVYLKATIGSVKDLSILPGQTPFIKGQQFQLSRDAVQIRSGDDLPSTVVRIMGYSGAANTALRQEVSSLDPGRKAFKDTNVAFGRKTVGLQFLDKELNRLIFGDSGVVMSGDLVRQMDVDPLSGLSRHTLTHKINLRSLDAARTGTTAGQLNFQGFLRSDLHNAILAHQDMLERGSRRITFKPGQEIQLEVFKEHYAQEGLKRRRTAAYAEAAFNVEPVTGHVILGESAKHADEVLKQDLRHTHDMLNIAKKRGLDPSKTFITGVRLIARSGELELTMAERIAGKDPARVMVDRGYILDSQRVSVGQVISKGAKERIFGLAKIDPSRSGLELVLGDLGLERSRGVLEAGKEGRQSFGFNVTLLRNLGQLISEEAGGDLSRSNVQKLTSAMGGEATIAKVGDRSIVQFAGLGDAFERVSDVDFMARLKSVAKETVGLQALLDESFTKVSLSKVLAELPGYQAATKQEQVAIEAAARDSGGSTSEIMRRLGVGRRTAAGLPALVGDQQWMIKSIAAELAIRGEEPLVKLGRDAVNIKLRDISMLGESIDFARGRKDVSGKEFGVRRILDMKRDLADSLIDSHPGIFKKNHDLSLMYQQRDYFKKDAAGFSKIEKALVDEKIGKLAVLKRAAKGIEVGRDSTLSVGKFKEAKTSIEQLLSQKQHSVDGKASLEAIGDTILGRRDPKTGVVKISDQAILVKGKHGPMIIPSAKAMGFTKEAGFLRVLGGSRNFNKKHIDAIANMKEGRVAGKEAQSMYLDILQDVERLKSAEGERLVTDTAKIEGRLDKLYGVMAGNTLSKQGLFYSSTVDPKGLKLGGRLRLQTHAQVGKFEVGVTEEALRSMAFGDKYSNIDKMIAQARNNKLYVTAVREPAAGGRQMLALKVKLLKDTQLASKSITEGFNFSGVAFLNTAMIQYGMEGDLDKDSVSIFRLKSMTDSTMEGIHSGQVEMMEGILNKLKSSPEEVAKRIKGTFNDIGDVTSLISDLEDTNQFRDRTVKGETFRSLIDIVGPKHSTPIIEAHFRGRSYVDHMIGQILDVQASGEGKSILRENLISRLGDTNAERVSGFLDKAAGIMGGSPGSRGGRSATYHYTDARNLIKYMHLKKVAHGGIATPADVILDSLKAAGVEARASMAAESSLFSDQLFGIVGDGTAKSRQLVDDVASNLLRAAQMINDDKNTLRALSETEPQTLSILHQLAGGTKDHAEQQAKLLAKRMIFVEMMSEELKVGFGQGKSTALGMPFESVLRDMGIVRQGFMTDRIMGAEAPGAVAMADIQAIGGGDSDQIIRSSIQDVMLSLQEDNQRRKLLDVQDQRAGSMANTRGVSSPHVPNSSYRNALISGEFFAKISQTKYFKPAAAIVGGLAGVEAIRSAMNRFSPGNVPATGYSAANAMPPPPMMSTPHDPTFHADAMPNTSIARVARSQGARSSLNVSGKMGSPPDFRGMTNQHALHNGYIPNIQGSFRSDLNDTMSRTEISQHLDSRMNSVF